MRQFGTVIGILRRVVNRARDQFSMRDAVASQLVRDNLPGFTAIISKQPFEKPPSSCAVASCLQKYIDYLSVLINGSPQVLLPAMNLHEHFVDEKCISKSLMPTLQALDILGPKLVTPQANGLIAHFNTSFRQQIFDIPATKIKSEIQPNGVLYDFRWKTMPLI
jgi:hypothetical protein